MPFNNEIEKTKKEIEVLTAKLSFLEELSKTKTPVEEGYKKVFGYYPMTDVGDAYWEYFQKGYEQSQKDYKVGEYQEAEDGATLYELLEEFLQYHNHRESICRLVRCWLYDNSTTVTEDYSTVTLKLKKGAFGWDD